jgi:hypothetical protein
VELRKNIIRYLCVCVYVELIFMISILSNFIESCKLFHNTEKI